MDIVACHRLDVKGLYVLNVTVSDEDPRYGPSRQRESKESVQENSNSLL